MTFKVFYLLWILPWCYILDNFVEAKTWSTILEELIDEQNDAEIYQSVVQSIKEWELHKKHSHRLKRETSRVCYEDVGCFEDTGPFSYLEMLPSPPKDVGTRFYVYGSRKARSVPMEVPADNINDKVSNAIDIDLPTKVIVHGFGSNCDHVWVYELRSALMSIQDCNIVCVDWSPGSATPNYVRAAANTRLVGRQLAKLILSLNVPLEKVHMIGFSLGAHVAGFAGSELTNVSRITGLDPAGPLFESQDPQVRLDETDANFVDVIHSNGEQLLLGGLGSWQQMGDVDFYPNGGRMQTGCSNLFLGAVSDFIWSGSIDARSLCNHRRAYKLFTDSISPKCRFPAFPCEKGYEGLLKGECFPCSPDRPCGEMGYYSDSSKARGQLYLVTRDEEPFCAQQYQIKVFNSQGERPARSYGKLQVTLVDSGSFNETFTMTRKDDEELLVGAVLHKIVVPHPIIVNLEAIEVKYTAYSGWISSGLSSWSIDKITILDSFGKSLSVCKKGLILESGKPKYLPIYPGECNIPFELVNSTVTNASLTSITSTTMKAESIEKAFNIETKASGIGPFTKENNFDRKDIYSVEVISNERNFQQKNVGPFTKEQNLRIIDGLNDKLFDINFVDINETSSNSLEHSEVESGRGFSGTGYSISSTASNLPINSDISTVINEFTSEIQEPVLQINKKETGRSMRLPEITEPILRPRSTRQNFKEIQSKEIDDKILDKTKDDESKSFTVQFLPERLAGILAQAERYARQTFLPLISQYTPSFVNSERQDKLKYFPPLTDVTQEKNNEEDEINTKIDKNNIYLQPKDNKNNSSRSDKQLNFETIPKTNASLILLKDNLNSSHKIESNISRNDDDWIPITKTVLINFNDNNTQSNQTMNKVAQNINQQLINHTTSTLTTESDDWVPIIEKLKVNTLVTKDFNESNNNSSNQSDTTTTTRELYFVEDKSEERKFIPLVDFENRDTYLAPTEVNVDTSSTTSKPMAQYSSHIQKIPGPVDKFKEPEDDDDDDSNGKYKNVRSMIFPYIYEENNDTKTRYIPLIREDDLGT